MAERREQAEASGSLRQLSDPEFMTRWAGLRQRLFYIPREEPRYPEVKRQYDEIAVEYRRRMGGGLAIRQRNH